MKKIVRNMSTAESRNFWETAERAASEVGQWPAWKRAGINVAQLRHEPRESVVGSTAKREQQSSRTK